MRRCAAVDMVEPAEGVDLASCVNDGARAGVALLCLVQRLSFLHHVVSIGEKKQSNGSDVTQIRGRIFFVHETFWGVPDVNVQWEK